MSGFDINKGLILHELNLISGVLEMPHNRFFVFLNGDSQLMNNKNPLVSVIIPTFNRAHLLERAIRSALNQTYSQLEVIVVDDSSSDDTDTVVDRLMKQDERVRYIRHDKNKGAQASRNTGIHAAIGDFVAFLDSDNEWLHSKLEKQMAVFLTGSNKLGVVYSGFRWEYSDSSPSTINTARYRGYIYKDALREWIADTSTLLVRKYILFMGGLWNERVRCDEWDLCIRLAKNTEFDFVAEPLSIYYYHEGVSISQNVCDRAIGYWDVINHHSEEILRELGRPALSIHLSSLGKYFIQANNFKIAKDCYKTAFRIWPFNPRPLANWLLCSLGPLVYFKVKSVINKVYQRF